MPNLDTRTAGNGAQQSAMWLDGVPCMVKGFHEWPKVGEKHLIDGVLYRLVEISDQWGRFGSSLYPATSDPLVSPSFLGIAASIRLRSSRISPVESLLPKMFIHPFDKSQDWTHLEIGDFK